MSVRFTPNLQLRFCQNSLNFALSTRLHCYCRDGIKSHRSAGDIVLLTKYVTGEYITVTSRDSRFELFKCLLCVTMVNLIVDLQPETLIVDLHHVQDLKFQFFVQSET
jgi:hypothetical protein